MIAAHSEEMVLDVLLMRVQPRREPLQLRPRCAREFVIVLDAELAVMVATDVKHAIFHAVKPQKQSIDVTENVTVH